MNGGSLAAVGYLRVSTARQKVIGMSLEAQQAAIASDVDRRGWTVTGWYEEARSTRLHSRPQLERAKTMARELQGVLVVARMDRAFRSNLEFQLTIAQASREGWAIVMLDPAVDLTSPYGKAMADVAVAFAELERALISQRTREAIEARRAAGIYQGGHRLPQCSPTSGPAQRRILALADPDRRGGPLSARQIAARLQLEGVPAPRGGTWWHTTVAAVLRRRQAG